MSTGDEAKVDVRERGANQQLADRRLFMQLHVLTGCADVKPLVRVLETGRQEVVLYQDLNDPRGIGLLARLAAAPGHAGLRLRRALIFALPVPPTSQAAVSRALH